LFQNHSIISSALPLHQLQSAILGLDFDELQPRPPLNCFNVRFDGRMGNLLFEYASLIGVCVKRGFDPKTCAGFPKTPSAGERGTV
jgi:hypothetical protein